jgi:hypothetical protein
LKERSSGGRFFLQLPSLYFYGKIRKISAINPKKKKRTGSMKLTVQKHHFREEEEDEEQDLR